MTVELGVDLEKQEFLLTRPSRDVTEILRPDWDILEISTHTPLAGRDLMVWKPALEKIVFLLTRPSRDVTGGRQKMLFEKFDFYSHAPRGT